MTNKEKNAIIYCFERIGYPYDMGVRFEQEGGMKFPSDGYAYFEGHKHLRCTAPNSAVRIRLKDGTEVEIWADKVKRVREAHSLFWGVYIEGWEVRMPTDMRRPEHLHGPTRVSVKVGGHGGGYICPGWGELEVQISRYLQG